MNPAYLILIGVWVFAGVIWGFVWFLEWLGNSEKRSNAATGAIGIGLGWWILIILAGMGTGGLLWIIILILLSMKKGDKRG
jgi:hypothetical protein